MPARAPTEVETLKVLMRFIASRIEDEELASGFTLDDDRDQWLSEIRALRDQMAELKRRVAELERRSPQ